MKILPNDLNDLFELIKINCQIVIIIIIFYIINLIFESRIYKFGKKCIIKINNKFVRYKHLYKKRKFKCFVLSVEHTGLDTLKVYFP